MEHRTIALVGNPNVGKSTVFNALTGMKQHTGNWTGKTVDLAQGEHIYNNILYHLIDLPGTYSLSAHSPEEEVTRDYIHKSKPDKILIVCDATCLKRNMILVLQTIALTPNVIICLNLMDEAKKKGIQINDKKLEEILGVPVVPVSARQGIGLKQLSESFSSAQKSHFAVADDIKGIYSQAEMIEKEIVFTSGCSHAKDLKADRILTGKYTGFPIMLCLLSVILWITVCGANYPSMWLSELFSLLYGYIKEGLSFLHCPAILSALLLDGIYNVTTWIISVMLPPMAIFFPLFTLLEDLGYLPRIAFNLDKYFQKACSCGKQALTMCMGFGCNAVGVTGCRIIDSPRERLIAILTNSFVPCNGRFPMLISIITIFFAGTGFFSGLSSALLLTGVILFSVCLTLIVSKLLSSTILKGIPSSFTLELPPYRPPQIGKVILRSILDRTIFVLGRAICVAAPAGLIIWILSNISIGNTNILMFIASVLDPLGSWMGLDGVILLAFILGLPANEIVVPIMLMIYTASGTLSNIEDYGVIRSILIANGWNAATAVSFLLFTIMHWPCSTTILTILKETRSIKWTLLGVLIPALFGVLICILWNLTSSVFF